MKATQNCNCEDLEFYNYLTTLLYEQLANLDSRERIVLFLRYWRSYSIAEIAKHFGINWDSANSTLDQAHSKLSQSESLQRGRSLLHFYQLGTLLKRENYESAKSKD